MKARNFPVVYAFAILINTAHGFENSAGKIDKANKNLTEPLLSFFNTCVVEKPIDTCVAELTGNPRDEFEMYVLGGALFDIDPVKAFKLHEEAYRKKPDEINFNLEYALELHRVGRYKEAIDRYLIFKKEAPKDYRIDVWLSECYLNVDNPKKAIKHWNASNHPDHHTGIDKAIHIIHGRTDQVKLRSDLVGKVRSKDRGSAYSLAYLDLNWEQDWWNSDIQEYFIKADLETIRKAFGEKSIEYQQTKTYASIKRVSRENDASDSMKSLLRGPAIKFDVDHLPPNGRIASDILRMAFANKIVDEKTYFEKEGKNVLRAAEASKDVDWLNTYAYLEASTKGSVSEGIDKKGWKEYKDFRFASSYFTGLREKNRYDNPDLVQALKDFPNSSDIHWVRLNCAKIEGKDIKADLKEVTKKEFKKLETDHNKSSYALKEYFRQIDEEF